MSAKFRRRSRSMPAELPEIRAAIIAKTDSGVGEFAGAVKIHAVDVVRAVFPRDLANRRPVHIAREANHSRRRLPAVVRIDAVRFSLGIAQQPIVESGLRLEKFRLQHQGETVIGIAVQVHAGAPALTRNLVNQIAAAQFVVNGKSLCSGSRRDNRWVGTAAGFLPIRRRLPPSAGRQSPSCGDRAAASSRRNRRPACSATIREVGIRHQPGPRAGEFERMRGRRRYPG